MATGYRAGAEVQKLMATAVIGGLTSATLLTLFVQPTLSARFEVWRPGKLPDERVPEAITRAASSDRIIAGH